MNNLREFYSPNSAVVWGRQIVAGLLIVCLTFTPVTGYARQPQISDLPAPGILVPPSEAYIPVLVRGMTLHPEDPLRFEFILDSGNAGTADEFIESESERLIKYFMAALTVPRADLWVNLSPHESDRVIPDELAKTQLGRDLLKQDYLLKQLSSSLLHPDEKLGKEFWQRVYKRAQAEYGTTDIPIDTFNKVWILPQEASVYEHDASVYVVDAHLRVMLDYDYQALQGTKGAQEHAPELSLTADIVREVILPEIEREVNSGENFAPLRQIYYSLILAKWYKETLQDSYLGQVYVDRNHVDGVDDVDSAFKESLYQQYLAAYKKGVFNFIKEDYDLLSQESIPRHYFSGGFKDEGMDMTRSDQAALAVSQVGDNFIVSVDITSDTDDGDNAMLGRPWTLKGARKVLDDAESYRRSPIRNTFDLGDYDQIRKAIRILGEHKDRNADDIRRLQKTLAYPSSLIGPIAEKYLSHDQTVGAYVDAFNLSSQQSRIRRGTFVAGNYWDAMNRTAKRLGELGDELGIEPMLKGVADGFISDEIKKALEMLGAVESKLVESYIRAVPISIKAVNELIELGDTAAVQPLLARLLKGDHRREVIEALGTLGDESVIEPLFGVITFSGNRHESLDTISATINSLLKLDESLLQRILTTILGSLEIVDGYDLYNYRRSALKRLEEHGLSDKDLQQAGGNVMRVWVQEMIMNRASGAGTRSIYLGSPKKIQPGLSVTDEVIDEAVGYFKAGIVFNVRVQGPEYEEGEPYIYASSHNDWHGQWTSDRFLVKEGRVWIEAVQGPGTESHPSDPDSALLNHWESSRLLGILESGGLTVGKGRVQVTAGDPGFVDQFILAKINTPELASGLPRAQTDQMMQALLDNPELTIAAALTVGAAAMYAWYRYRHRKTLRNGLRMSVRAALRELDDNDEADAVRQNLQALLSRDQEEMRDAIAALGEMAHPAATEPLIWLLNKGYFEDEVSLANALAAIGDDRAIPHLIERIRSREVFQRLPFKEALKRFRTESEVQELLELRRGNKLFDTDRGLSPALFTPFPFSEALMKFNLEEHVGALVQLLESPSGEVRQSAEGLLHGINNAEKLIAYQDSWERRQTPELALGLAEAGDGRSLDAVVQITSGSMRADGIGGMRYILDSTMVERAVRALGRIRAESSLDALHQLLRSAEFKIRMAVLTAIGEINSTRSIKPLTPMLGDEIQSVRERAHDILSQYDIDVDALRLAALRQAHATVVPELAVAAVAAGSEEQKIQKALQRRFVAADENELGGIIRGLDEAGFESRISAEALLAELAIAEPENINIYVKELGTVGVAGERIGEVLLDRLETVNIWAIPALVTNLDSVEFDRQRTGELLLNRLRSVETWAMPGLVETLVSIEFDRKRIAAVYIPRFLDSGKPADKVQSAEMRALG